MMIERIPRGRNVANDNWEGISWWEELKRECEIVVFVLLKEY